MNLHRVDRRVMMVSSSKMIDGNNKQQLYTVVLFITTTAQIINGRNTTNNDNKNIARVMLQVLKRLGKKKKTQRPRRKIQSTSKMLGLDPPPPTTISFPTPIARASTASTSSKRRRHYDYMELPSSMAYQHRPREAWEVNDTTGRNQKRSRPLMAVLLFITLALAAGTFMEGEGGSGHDQQEHSHAHSSSHHHHHPQKKRGKWLPAASERKEGIAEDMYKVYRELEQEYHAKAFSPQNENKWKLLNKKEDVKVSLLEHADDPTCPYVRMEALVPSSVQECWDFLSIPNWHITMPKMDPFYEDHEIHYNYTHKGVNMILVRKRTHRIYTFGKRDFVFLSVSDEPLEDGTWVSGTVSVETSDLKRQHGYTRAFQDSIAFYKPVRNEETGQEQCHLTIVCRIDMNDSSEEGSGGFMPMWLYVKTIGTTGTKSVIRMRDALIEMKKEREKKRLESSVPTSATSTTSIPPTLGPVIGAEGQDRVLVSTADEKESMNEGTLSIFFGGKTKQTWWDRLRGGALVPQRQPNSGRQDLLRWKPLYEVFTHYPSKQAPNHNRRDNASLDSDIGNKKRSWVLPNVRLPWLQQLVASRKVSHT